MVVGSTHYHGFNPLPYHVWLEPTTMHVWLKLLERQPECTFCTKHFLGDTLGLPLGGVGDPRTSNLWPCTMVLPV